MKLSTLAMQVIFFCSFANGIVNYNSDIEKYTNFTKFHVNRFDFSSDGKYLARTQSLSVYLHDYIQGTQLSKAKFVADYAWVLKFSPDNKKIALITQNGTLAFYLIDGDQITIGISVDTGLTNVSVLEFLDNENLFLGHQKLEAFVFFVSNSTLRWNRNFPEEAYSFKLSNDKTQMFVVYSQDLFICDITVDNKTDYCDHIYMRALSVFDYNRTMFIVQTTQQDIIFKQKINSMESVKLNVGSAIIAAQISSNSEVLAISTTDQSIFLIDMPNFPNHVKIKVDFNSRQFKFTSDSSKLYLKKTSDDMLAILDIATLEMIPTPILTQSKVDICLKQPTLGFNQVGQRSSKVSNVEINRISIHLELIFFKLSNESVETGNFLIEARYANTSYLQQSDSQFSQYFNETLTNCEFITSRFIYDQNFTVDKIPEITVNITNRSPNHQIIIDKVEFQMFMDCIDTHKNQTNECKCNEGYEQFGENCIPQCPMPFQNLSNNCECNEGYKTILNECSEIPKVCPKLFQDINMNCTCILGFILSGEDCVCSKEFRDRNNNCNCIDLYTEVNGECTPQQPQQIKSIIEKKEEKNIIEKKNELHDCFQKQICFNDSKIASMGCFKKENQNFICHSIQKFKYLYVFRYKLQV